MAPAAPAPNVSQSMVSHDLMTVAAYADTLDALPLDLTRGFSDLRELDAVLSASLIHLTGAIKSLTSVLLNPNAEPGERLAILREVAEYAQRFKLGGEDKIRVVGGVCEGVISHQTHLSNLLSHSSLLTARPPSPPGSSSTVYLPPTTTGKRTRTGANASLTTPARKVQRRDAGAGGKGRAGSSSHAGQSANGGDEWDDVQKSPQKGGAKKALARGRKVETNNRGVSPAPSNLSQSFTAFHHNPSPRPSDSRAGSTLPSSVYPPSDPHGGHVTNEHLNLVDSVTPGGRGVGEKIDDLDHVDSLANGGDGMEQGAKGKGKGRAGAGSSRRNLGVDDDEDEGPGRGGRGSGRGGRNTRGGTAVSGEGGEDSGDDVGTIRRTASRRQARLPAGGRDETPSAAHPNYSDAESSRLRQSGDEGSDEDGVNPRRGAEGAGNTTVDSAGTGQDDPETGDKKVYCYCNGVSYGEMIGCDDDDCPIEWFHLDCLDLTEPPEGSWLCPDCTLNRTSKGRKGRK